jgi:hypothetical protein
VLGLKKVVDQMRGDGREVHDEKPGRQHTEAGRMPSQALPGSLCVHHGFFAD